MTVRVEGIPEVIAEGARETARLRALGGAVLAVAKSAADVERSSHAYQNRTGRLEGLTGAEHYDTGDGFEVHLHQGAFYGAFLQAFGPPWSDFESIAGDAEAMIDGIIEGDDPR